MHYALDTSSPTEIRASISACAAEVDEAIRDFGEDARLLLADRLVREVMERYEKLTGHDGYTEEIAFFCDVIEGKIKNEKKVIFDYITRLPDAP